MGSGRVFRGGIWRFVAVVGRASCRGGDAPDTRSEFRGFRVVRELPVPGLSTVAKPLADGVGRLFLADLEPYQAIRPRFFEDRWANLPSPTVAVGLPIAGPTSS